MPDLERATTWSEDRVLALLQAEHDPSVQSVAWVGSGHWSDCFAFEGEVGPLVVRIGHHVQDFRKDRFASRFRRPGLPIPAIAMIGRAHDAWFAISERVGGEPLEQADDWGALVSGAADLLEALRAADLGDTRGWGRWNGNGIAPASSWREFLLDVDQDPPGGRVSGWKEKLAAVPSAQRAFDESYERLHLTATNDVPRSLVHNDLLNRNTHVRDQSIGGVFDWGNALFGDHLYDLALFYFWQPWLPRVRHRAVLAELRRRWALPGNGVANFEARFDACLLHIALEHLAYGAFLGNWPNVESIADRVDEVVGSV